MSSSLDVDINDLGSKPASIEFLVSFKNMLTFQKKKKKAQRIICIGLNNDDRDLMLVFFSYERKC